jgi:hypothetical protein
LVNTVHLLTLCRLAMRLAHLSSLGAALTPMLPLVMHQPSILAHFYAVIGSIP